MLLIVKKQNQQRKEESKKKKEVNIHGTGSCIQKIFTCIFYKCAYEYGTEKEKVLEL